MDWEPMLIYYKYVRIALFMVPANAAKKSKCRNRPGDSNIGDQVTNT